MPFVKLDTGILESTLWIDPVARDIFITALLMAEPYELTEPTPQLKVMSLEKTGFVVPPGWYGFIHAAGVGIVRRALMDPDMGLQALVMLGSPDLQSRSADFEGRRLVRVDGGFILLNYIKYREKDHGAAERMRLFRQRKKESVTPEASPLRRTVTYADADAEVYTKESLVLRAENPIAPEAVIERVWTYYREQTGKRYSSLTEQKLKMGLARYREALAKAAGDPEKAETAMRLAVDQLVQSDWHMGRDKNSNGKKYDSWEIMFRSADKFQEWVEKGIEE